MWDEQKQSQLDELRQQADRGLMTAEQQERLDQLVHDLEQQEWQRLRPALDASLQEQQRLQSQIGRVRMQNAILAALVERYSDILARARVQLNSLADEREALRAEYDRIVQ